MIMKTIMCYFGLFFAVSCGGDEVTEPFCDGNEAHDSSGISFCQTGQICVATGQSAFCALETTPSPLCTGADQICENNTTRAGCNDEGYIVTRFDCSESPGGFCDDSDASLGVACAFEERILTITVAGNGRAVFDANNTSLEFEVDGTRSQQVPLGAQIDVRATPDLGFDWGGWGQSACSDDSTMCSFTVNDDMEFNILFVEE